MHLKSVLLLHRQIIKKLSGMSNPAIYLRGVQHKDIKNIIEFMYIGEVNVAQEDLDSFLGVAQDLCIKGLTQSDSKPEKHHAPPPPPPQLAKRPRLSAPQKMDNDKQKVKQETTVVHGAGGNNVSSEAAPMETYEEYYEAGAIDDLGDDGKGTFIPIFSFFIFHFSLQSFWQFRDCSIRSVLYYS